MDLTVEREVYKQKITDFRINFMKSTEKFAMNTKLLILSIFSIGVVTATNNLYEKGFGIDQILSQYELEVQRLPEYDDESILELSANKSLDDLLNYFEKEAQMLDRKRYHADYSYKPKQDLAGAISDLLGGSGTPGSGGAGGILGNLLGGLGGLVCKLLMEVAELIRKLAKILSGTLSSPLIQQTKETLIQLLGQRHFLVRFLNEFFNPENSIFKKYNDINERLDKIMDVFWAKQHSVKSR